MERVLLQDQESLTENERHHFCHAKVFYCLEKDRTNFHRYLVKEQMYTKGNSKRTVIKHFKNCAYIYILFPIIM